jgi:cobalt-zinc-cadmium efflux system protein
MAGELAVGLIFHSLALVSDAAHMVVDLATLLLTAVALRLSKRGPGDVLTYGWRRLEALTAQGSGGLLLVLAGAILYGAVLRLIHPAAADGAAMVGAGLAGVVANLLGTAALRKGRGHNLAVEASYQHLFADLAAFIATVVAGGCILAFGLRRADPLAALFAAALMVRSGIGLLAASGRVLLEGAPPGLEPAKIGPVLAAVAGVVEVHDLHVWQVGSDLPVLTAHVLIAEGEDPHEVRLRLEEVLRERFGLHHSTLQVDHPPKPRLIELEPPRGASDHGPNP